jgi:acetyl esterase/lipase
MKNLKWSFVGYMLIFLLTIFMDVSAQNKVIDIWNGKVPNAIPNVNYQQIVDSADNWIKMRFVKEPTMDMYLASPEKATGTAVIICPGGAYWGLAIDHEGKQVAQWLNSLGITAFVLKYRLPDDAIMPNKSVGAMQDGQEAIRIVRRYAKEWGIHPNKIGMMGFSAGGHLASTLSTHFKEKVYEAKDSTNARPDFSLLIYPVISMDESITHMGSRFNLLGEKPADTLVRHFSNELQVCQETPPAFLVHSIDDDAVPVQNSIHYVLALKKFKIPCELHIYQSGGHGYGLGRSDNTESTWTEACAKWLKARGFL